MMPMKYGGKKHLGPMGLTTSRGAMSTGMLRSINRLLSILFLSSMQMMTRAKTVQKCASTAKSAMRLNKAVPLPPASSMRGLFRRNNANETIFIIIDTFAAFCFLP